MQAGKLNKRVTIYQSVLGSPARDELGEPNYDWEKVATVWASVSPVVGKEFWSQQQIQSEVTSKIKIRYRSDILPGMKIVYAVGDINKEYIIETVIDFEEKHKELQLMCSEGVKNV
jgi:SPP1 family predicted phage head-tail adaptor